MRATVTRRQRQPDVHDLRCGQPGLAAVNGLGYRTSSLYDAAGQRTRLVDAGNHRVTLLLDPAVYARAVHVWDLAAIRQRLKPMDLD